LADFMLELVMYTYVEKILAERWEVLRYA
jgi:hypothetical protein